ncbi:MAG TPA: hypothetical protein VIS07_04875 [Candidatus Binatia bacterium]
MPGANDVVQKPKIFLQFEEQSQKPGWHTNSKFLSALEILQDTSISDMDAILTLVDGAGSAGQMPAAMSKHFKEHWLGYPNDTNHYWKGIKTEKLLRAGMRLVCETFQQAASAGTQKPCEYFWVNGRTMGSKRWEVVVAEGVKHITVLFVTPVPTYNGPPPSTQPNPKIRKVFPDSSDNAVVQPIEEP